MTIKLKDYAKVINKLAKQHPDVPVVYAIDDEGNDFRGLVYQPSVGKLDNGCEYGVNLKPINACCIN